MSSRKSSSQPEITRTCGECGGALEEVRPGKWQCPHAPHTDTPAAESLPVPPALAALFAAHGVTSMEPRRPDEFGVEEYAAYRGISTGSANAELLKMERSGRVTRRLMMRQYIYRFADGGGKAT